MVTGIEGSRRKEGRGWRTAVGVLAAVLVGCISDYNPFSDTRNVGVHVERTTVHDGDTVELFAAETIQVLVLVPELVEQVRVSAGANRTWSDTDTVIAGADTRRTTLRFVVSFHDTGRQYVAFTTEQGGRALSTDTVRLYVRSPLAPDSVIGCFGDTVTLRTAPVRVPGITYVWSFGPGSEVAVESCSARVVVRTAAEGGIGTLWVTDGRYRSPAVPVPFRLVDTVGPVIRCLNAGYGGGDTVFTGDSSFNLRLSITDRGVLRPDSASINGGPFDFALDTLFVKLFTGMHRHPPADPLRAMVLAFDGAPGRNASRRVLYIAFVDTAPVSKRVSFELTQPERDSLTTGAANFVVAGTFSRLGVDTLPVLVETSLKENLWTDTVRLGAPITPWSRLIALEDSVNRLVVRVLDTARAETIAVVHRALFFDSLLADTSPPVILHIRVGGYNADRYISTVPRVLLRVNATDPGVGVDSVFINDKPAPAYSSAGWWADSVSLVHRTLGNEFGIRVRDRYGNTATATVVMFFNRRPVFTRAPGSATIGFNTTYRETLAAVDPDGDPIRFAKSAGPAGMQVAADGVITWRPTSADTGTHSVTVLASDPYQATGHSYLLHVADLSAFTPVRFRTRVSEFPVYLTAGRDTLRIALRVDSSSGVQPYLFTARVVTAGLTLLNQSPANVLVWAPDSTQLGVQQLMVVVRDNIGAADTIYPRILVAPSNAPCSLTVRYASPTRSDGTVDINALAGPDTLRFQITDLDDASFERHTVTLRQARTGVTTVFDSVMTDTFRLMIDPRAFDGYDTVVARVVDIAGHGDTLVLPLYYGVAPVPPTLVAPPQGADSLEAPVMLHWGGGDPDGDALVYDVYVGTGPGALNFIASTTDTVYTLPGLAGATTYYWQIRASDWKRTSASPVQNFRTR